MAKARVYIGLGANLNQPVHQLQQAIEALQQLPDSELIAVSSLYGSKPMGPQDQPDYVNAVAEVSTTLNAMALLDALRTGQPVGLQQSADGQRLKALELAVDDEHTETLALDALLPRLGLSPKLGPIADWGLAMERKLLTVDPATLATDLAGVYAVGDICHYPGKRKLLLCGFHEATMAAFAISAYLRPEQRQLLQYTTTSPRLHELLGVAGNLART